MGLRGIKYISVQLDDEKGLLPQANFFFWAPPQTASSPNLVTHPIQHPRKRETPLPFSGHFVGRLSSVCRRKRGPSRLSCLSHPEPFLTSLLFLALAVVVLHHLANDLGGLFVRLQQLLALLALLLDAVILVQELFKHGLAVQLGHKTVLDLVTAVVNQ